MTRSTDNPKLEWFLSFLNTNLDELGVIDRIKLQIDMAGAFSVPVNPRDMSTPLNPEWIPVIIQKDVNWLKDLQSEFGRILTELGAMGKAMERSVQQGKTTMNPEEYVTLTRMPSIRLTVEVSLTIEPEEPPEFCSTGVMPKTPSFTDMETRPLMAHFLDVRISGQNIDDVLMFHFLNALKGLRVDSVDRCEECRKWFMRTSERSRLYCSNACATKRANRQRYIKVKATPGGKARPGGVARPSGRASDWSRRSIKSSEISTNNMEGEE